MQIYRFIHKTFANRLTGSGVDGRWNSGGRKVAYASENVAVAFTESMFRRKGTGFSTDYCVDVLEVPTSISIDVVDPLNLKPEWRLPTQYPYCQSIGDLWYDAMAAPILKVPSAVFGAPIYLFNYVLNLNHPDIKHIRIIQSEIFVPDERYESILRNL